MSVGDLIVEVRARHVSDGYVVPGCCACESDWPCDVARLVEALAAALEREGQLRAALMEAHFHTRSGPGYPYGREGADWCEVCRLLGVPIGVRPLVAVLAPEARP